MDEILRRASKKSGVDYYEFLSGIREAQYLCGMDGMSEAEFVRHLTKVALREYFGNERTEIN
jgi:hypothetical protein